MVLPAPPALALGTILPHLRIGRLTGIPARLPPGASRACPNLVILGPGELLRLRRPERGRRYLLSGGPHLPGQEWLCRARVLAGRAATGVFGWPSRNLLAWCDCLLIADQAGRARRFSSAELRLSACLRVTGYGPGFPPLVSREQLRQLGTGRFEADLPLARHTAEEILSAWLAAGWRVEASGVTYPALETVLDRAVPEDRFPALPALTDRYRCASREPADAP